MDQQLSVAVAAAIGFVLGLVVAWLILRGRYRAQQEAAVAIAQAGIQANLAAAQAQVGQLDVLLKATQGELTSVRAQATGWRNDLDTARDLGAKFEERANRIPGLEAILFRYAIRASADDDGGAVHRDVGR